MRSRRLLLSTPCESFARQIFSRLFIRRAAEQAGRVRWQKRHHAVALLDALEDFVTPVIAKTSAQAMPRPVIHPDAEFRLELIPQRSRKLGGVRVVPDAADPPGSHFAG